MLSLERWQQQEYTGLRLGLGRIRAFLSRVGNPERRFRAVHIAGTNGKGSTACMTAAILGAAGYRVGLYTSPHLVRLEERIQVDGTPVSVAVLRSLARRHESDARKCELTFFEYMTGLAFLYFARQRIDVAVLETGLGGRYDATNVIARPAVTVITEIGRDHCTILGSRIAQIAAEKAGIIKRNVPVVTAASSPAVHAVIRRTALRLTAPVYQCGKDFSSSAGSVDWRRIQRRMIYRGSGPAAPEAGARGLTLTLPLPGEFQVRNASLAAAACCVLRSEGWHIADTDIVRGIARARWPGRFDVRRFRQGARPRTMVIDGAHNPQAAAAFARAWRGSPWGRVRRPFVFGMLGDKEYRAVVKTLAPLMSEAIIVTVPSPRALPAEDLARCFKTYRNTVRVTVAGSISDALSRARQCPVSVVAGSLYLAGAALKSMDTTRR